MTRRALPPRSRHRIKRQPPFHDGVEQDAERPRVRGAAVVFLAHEDLGSGVVRTAAAGVEEWGLGRAGDPAAETEVGEGDDGGRVGLPVGGCDGEGGRWDVDEDVWVGGLADMLGTFFVGLRVRTFELDVAVYNVSQVQIPYCRD